MEPSRRIPLSELLREILEVTRWAPSGDNTQPWRFEPLGGAALRVNGFDTREHCVYDLDGWPSRISIGAMLETMRIAAASRGMRAVVRRDRTAADERPVFDVEVVPHPRATSLRTGGRSPFPTPASRPATMGERTKACAAPSAFR